MALGAAEIRETYLAFFEEREHRRVPSASLIPAAFDPSVLLTTAGMQPFKPYFLGSEQPPAPRVCSSQRCFRTTDVEQVGLTARHLTFFEMLGNWSFGDYFKEETIPWGWELSVEGFGLDPERIWVTVFEGDDELGLGPDEEAIAIWRGVGVPDERIVRLPRSENFWQAGPTGPCGPCSEMYLDRGPEHGEAGDLPGGDNDRFVEYWNHVFMSYDLAADGSLTDLPSRNIDTGLGIERMAAILQDAPSVFESDAFAPVVELVEEMSGKALADGGDVTRAIRVLADHARGTAALIADGVVPSNEDRGYVLRRIMRRAIQRGRSLGIPSPFMASLAERALESLIPAFPELADGAEAVRRWAGDEEEAFGKTLERGTQLLEELVESARASNTSWVDASEAFRLHDTFGFPYDLTKELLAEQGLSVDDQGFDELMAEQRRKARMGTATAHGSEDSHDEVLAFTASAPPSRFVGYERLATRTSLAAVGLGERALVKLEESPFYAEGGGQVADGGSLRWEGGEARVVDVYRVGEDQALRLEPADIATELEQGVPVEAEVESFARHSTMRNHTATHLLHAALREVLGDHVRQAGSSVRPDKLRFDFTHSSPLSEAERQRVETLVNDWVMASHPVRAIQMSRDEAEALGAMALFGEKYGDWVRVVEVEGVSRELCGGTHVRNTAEIGVFKIESEGSSASNVRRIEALTGPAAVSWLRERSDQLDEVGRILGGSWDAPAAAAERLRSRLDDLESVAQGAGREELQRVAGELADSAQQVGEVSVIVGRADGGQKDLLELADRLRRESGDGAVVLGGADGDKAALVASFGPGAVSKGLSAATVVRDAAELIGGGGGGRDDAAQAGGKQVAKVDDALAQAREAIATALEGGD